MPGNSSFYIHDAARLPRPWLRPALARNRSRRGTALIETAILMPLYMLILLGVIYFGYAALTKQQQGVATAYAAWLPGGESATNLLTDFWPWAGTPAGANAQATAGDTTLALPLQQTPRIRQGDEYYNGYSDYSSAVPPAIPSQLTAGNAFFTPGGTYNQLLPGDAGAGNDVFEESRVAVELWNYALGHTIQSFTWTPGAVTQQMNTNYDEFARYLNTDYSGAFNLGGGLVTADPGSPPALGVSSQATPPFNGQWLDTVLDGQPGGGLWLQRRTAVSLATYLPPLFPQIFADSGTPATTFTNYAAGNYPSTTYVPTSTRRFDVTGRDPTVFRYAAGEGGQTPASVLTQAGGLLSDSLTPPLQDNYILNCSPTVQGSWSAQPTPP